MGRGRRARSQGWGKDAVDKIGDDGRLGIGRGGCVDGNRCLPLADAAGRSGSR
jgi:hypothetical protein